LDTVLQTWKHHAKSKLNDLLIWQKLLVITASPNDFHYTQKRG